MNINCKIKVFSSLLLFGFFCYANTSFAQSDPTGERRVTGTYAIKNATVTTKPGNTLTGATIIIKDGIISDVGKNLRIPSEAQQIDADSLYIYAGFIDGASTAGVSTPAEPDRPSNFNPSDPSDEIAGITPWRSVLDYRDLKNNQVNEWRKVGITVAQLIPDGGMLPGKAAIVTFGGTTSSNVIAQNTALAAKFRGAGRGRGMYPGTQLGIMAKFRDLYRNAELASEHSRLFASAEGLSRPEVNKTLGGFNQVLDKSIPILFEVTDDLEARRALSLQKEYGFRLVLSGLTHIDEVIESIKAANAQVLLSIKLPDDKASKVKTDDFSDEADTNLERVKEAYEKSLQQAGLLEREGIKFGFSSMGAQSTDLIKNLRLMIENGLSENGALAGLTVNSAEILGIQKFAGTIEKGKLANLVITNGPLFEEETQIRHVVADGYIFDYEFKEKKKNGESKEGSNEAVPIAGVWDYTSDTPAGSSRGTMTIEKKGDVYEGKITYDDPAGSGTATSTMESIQLSGSKLSFRFSVVAGGMDLDVTVTGDVYDDKYSGKMSLAEFGSFPLNADKKPN